MERFGFFDVTQVGYDRANSSVLDTQRVHIAMRHNIWQHHHALTFGADTAALCNADADCANGTVCHIGNSPRDASHRGACAPLAVRNATGEGACSNDDD